MHSTVSISPFRCRMWAHHDRIEAQISEETCRIEIESFSAHGQLVPVLGRTLRGDPACDVELIYGARRLFVARHLNKPLLVQLRDLSDKDAIIAMDIENRHRSDISPYERGLSYARWLRTGHFPSQDDLARALKISSSQVSRLLKLSRLPSVVVNAFKNPAEICEGWGASLIEVLDDPNRRQATLNKARVIASSTPRPPARLVYQELLRATVQGRKVRPQARDIVVKDSSGMPLFRIRHRRDTIALLLPVGKVSAPCLEDIQLYVANCLVGPSTHAAVPAAPGRSRVHLEQL